MATSTGARVNTNINAMNAYNALTNISNKIGTISMRLATGKRLNSAGDDPASFTISRKMESRAAAISQAINNTGDAKSVLAIADGGLEQISDTLVTIKEKASQATNGTFGSDELGAIVTQVNDYLNEIDDTISTTKFSNQKLLSANFTNKAFQVGPDSTDQLTISLDTQISSADFGLNNLTTSNIGSATTIASIDAAINAVSSELQKVGSLTNRMDSKESMLNVQLTNIDAAVSRLSDADLAKEQMDMMKYQILQNTATAQLAQANAAPQQYLQLFK
jgi:flagellin